MTVAHLLTWILAALFLQVAVGAGVVLWRRRVAMADSAATPIAPVSRASAAWPGTRAFRVRSREFEDAAHSQCSFRLEPVDGAPLPEFKPGQFLTFQLAVPDPAQPGGRRAVTRCYSLSDRPAATHYRVTIKRVPAPAGRPDLPPGVSSSHFHDHVQVDDVLQVKAPSGHFHIDGDVDLPVVLVAGGIGITPMMSMLRWCVAAQPRRKVHLFYGLRNGSEHAFRSELGDIAAHHPQVALHVVYSRPGPQDRPGADYQHTGHVDIGLLQQALPPGRHAFYVCGPASMMASVVPALRAAGVAEADVHFEAFGPASVPSASVPLAASGVASDVRFTRSGRTLAWDGRDANLLDFAERHGVLVDSGCRSGGCGSCETRLLSGTVVYDQPPDHDIAPGHCLLCVGRPAAAVALELEA